VLILPGQKKGNPDRVFGNTSEYRLPPRRLRSQSG